MKIGQLSKISGCSVQTIRYYESEGLLSTPERTEGNFRLYGERIQNELEFVKHCRSLNIPLTDVKRLIELKNKPEASCHSVNKLIDTQLKLVNERMKELLSLKSELQQMANACKSDTTINDCGIVRALEN
jgi:Cd(II)/Pb(II)-responsive transcriptional regulator